MEYAMRTGCLQISLFLSLSIMNCVISIAQTSWTKYAGNPVLSGGEYGSWNRQLNMPCVLYNSDSARYEMWFAASAFPATAWKPYRIGFAASTDGIIWKVHPAAVLEPTAGTWDSYNVDMPCVVRENGGYKMWYTGGMYDYEYKTGYATSPDGINWTKHPSNPIFLPRPGSWEAAGVHCGFVVPVAGGYRMYYSGFATYIYSPEHIGTATSADGLVWQRDTVNNPVLSPSADGEWDDTWVFLPKIVFHDSLFYMWYGGYDGYYTNSRVGLATSRNGIGWKKHPGNPVLLPSPGQWDASMTLSGCVLLVGDTLYMWYDATDKPYTSYPWRIGLAKSRYVRVAVGHETYQPAEFLLHHNYPNPFNPTTTIKFELPKSSDVRLSVFDMLGREVSVLMNERRDVGVYDVKFDASGLSSGVYFYRLHAGDFVQIHKLLLVK
jgi:predicted GH43/DUF377 family glycosyl hydrolase